MRRTHRRPRGIRSQSSHAERVPVRGRETLPTLSGDSRPLCELPACPCPLAVGGETSHSTLPDKSPRRPANRRLLLCQPDLPRASRRGSTLLACPAVFSHIRAGG